MELKDGIAGILATLSILCMLLLTVVAFHPMNEKQANTKDVLHSGEGEFGFGFREDMHMWDVYNLFVIVRFIAMFGLFVILDMLTRKQKWAIGTASTLLIVLPIVSVLIPWDVLFLQFHEIFFPQGNFTFPASSSLIITYPESFFQISALIVGVGSIIIGIIGFLHLRFLNQKSRS